MPRPSKPRFRKQSQTWVSTIRGQFYTLGKTKKEAFDKFHRICLGNDPVPTKKADARLADLVNAFLAYQRTRIVIQCFNSYHQFLAKLVNRFGRHHLASTLDCEQVQEWIDNYPTWNQTTRTIAVKRIKACFRWACKKNILAENPLKNLKGPGELSRDTALSPEQFSILIAHPLVDDDFRDLLVFLWETGVRPSEAYRLQAGSIQVDKRIATFRGKTTKETGQHRIIYLNDAAMRVIHGRKVENNGTVFKSINQKQWTEFSVQRRLARIRDNLGWSWLNASSLRRSFATEAAIRGVPVHVIAELLGHRGPQQIFSHYAKVRNRPDKIFEALNQVRPSNQDQSTDTNAAQPASPASQSNGKPHRRTGRNGTPKSDIGREP